MKKTTVVCRQKIAAFLTKNRVGGAKLQAVLDYAADLEKQHRTKTATPRIRIPACDSICGVETIAYFGQPEDFQ